MRSLLPALLLASAAPALAQEPLSVSALDGFFSGASALPVSLEDLKAQKPPPPLPVWVDVEAVNKEEQEALKKYGDVMTPDQRIKMQAALDLLMDTEAGREICRGAAPNGCDFREFAKYGVELRVKYLPGAHAETPTYFIGTKKVITVNTGMFDPKLKYGAGDMASVLAHELSHVQDVGRFQSALPEARLATEKKAFMAGLEVYSEIFDQKGSQVTDKLGMHMFMYAWRRKFENGPNMEFAGPGGKETLDAFIARTMYGKNTPDAFVDAMTRHYYPAAGFFTVGPNTARVEKELQVRINRKIDNYSEWRKLVGMNKPSYDQAHKPPAVTQLNLGGSGGASNGGSNGWTNPQPVHPPQPVTPPPPPVQPVHPPQPVQPPPAVNPHPQPVQPVQPPPPPPQVDDDPPPTWSDDPVDIGPDNPLYPDNPQWN